MMKPLSLLSLLIPCFAFAGCVSIGPTIQPMSLATASMIATTLVQVEEPVLPSNTPSPTKTLMSFDTLEPAHARETIQPLLGEPMNCAVPCFWGIVPGKTSLNEAKIFFSKLGFSAFEGINPNSGAYFFSISYDFHTGYDSYATFHTDNNDLIENIVVTPDIPKPQKGVPREWIAYSPETLIKHYGSPSSVRFTVGSYGMAGSSPNIAINMIMYFDASDLIVHYSGYNMTPERFCPLTAPFDFVRIWIGHNPPDTPSFDTVSLEKATSLTINEFTQLMMKDTQRACFTLNENASP